MDKSLSLSGGGSNGLFYAPLVKEIEKKGIVFKQIFGTSIGAVFGALIACGYSHETIKKCLLDFPKDEQIKKLIEIQKEKSIFKRIFKSIPYLFLIRWVIDRKIKKMLKKHLSWDKCRSSFGCVVMKLSEALDPELIYDVYNDKEKFRDIGHDFKERYLKERPPYIYLIMKDGVYNGFKRVSKKKVPMWKAVRASMALPPLKGIHIRGLGRCIDGGLLDNYACSFPYGLDSVSVSCVGSQGKETLNGYLRNKFKNDGGTLINLKIDEELFKFDFTDEKVEKYFNKKASDIL